VSKGGWVLFCFVGWLLAFGSPLVSWGGGEIFPRIYLPTSGQVAPDDVAGLSNHFWGFLSNFNNFFMSQKLKIKTLTKE
jgi:hypothetical protein